MHYRVSGTFTGAVLDGNGKTVKESHGTIAVTIQAGTPEQAAINALREKAREEGLDDYDWLGEPEIVEVPEDVSMNLIGAERLPGF